MKEKTSIVLVKTTGSSELSTELAESRENRDRLRLKSRSENTVKAYASDWKIFTTWCSARGLRSMPSDPDTVSMFVSDLARGVVPDRDGNPRRRKMSTILRYVSSIAKAHKTAEKWSPTKHTLVVEALDGAKRELTLAKTQKDAVTIELLLELLKFVKPGSNEIRDRAILLLGFYTGSRRSEVTELNFDDILFDKNGIAVVIRKSKSDQFGQGMTKFIPATEAECIEALNTHLTDMRRRGISTGPLFRPMTKNGNYRMRRMNDKHVATLIKQTVRDAFKATKDLRLEFVEDFAGHSLRAGLVTTLALKGVPSHRIQKKTGHKLSRTVDEYIRDRNIRTVADWENDPTFNLSQDSEKTQ